MRRRLHRAEDASVFEVFADMALLMLAAFIFMFALVLIVSQSRTGDDRASKQEIAQLQSDLSAAQSRIQRLQEEMNTLAGADVNQQMDKVLASAGWGQGQGKRDFDLFIQGLKDLPGTELHLIVDATGSMHGATTFLIPVLRVIAIRSGKHLAAVSWYADKRVGTYEGSMGSMFDQLMKEAPFVGSEETIGHAFRTIARTTAAPSAYLLIGDEPSVDRIAYLSIPAPVFTLPLGSSDVSTRLAFQQIADKTAGKMLEMQLK